MHKSIEYAAWTAKKAELKWKLERWWARNEYYIMQKARPILSLLKGVFLTSAAILLLVIATISLLYWDGTSEASALDYESASKDYKMAAPGYPELYKEYLQDGILTDNEYKSLRSLYFEYVALEVAKEEAAELKAAKEKALRIANDS